MTKLLVRLEAKSRCVLHRSWAAYISTCARGNVPPFPYLRNGWTDWAQIGYVVRDPLAWRFTKVSGEVQVHVMTCAPLFRIFGTAERIALKLGVWLEDH